MTGLRDTLISESTLVCSIPRRVSLASALTPPPACPALYASLYLLLVLAFLRPRLLIPFAHWLLSVLLSPSDFIPSRPLFSLSSQYTRSMSPFITCHPEPDLSFSLFALRTSSCLSKRVFLFDSFVLSFFCRVVPSRFRVPYASLLSNYSVPRSRCFSLIVSSPSHPLDPFLTPSFASTHAHFLSRSYSPGSLRLSSLVSLHPSGLLLAHSLLPSLSRLSARTSTIAHPRHHPVTSPIALFHAPDRECALISHSLSLCLPLALSLPLFLPFAFTSSLFIYSLTLPSLPSLCPFSSSLRYAPYATIALRREAETPWRNVKEPSVGGILRKELHTSAIFHRRCLQSH